MSKQADTAAAANEAPATPAKGKVRTPNQHRLDPGKYRRIERDATGNEVPKPKRF